MAIYGIDGDDMHTVGAGPASLLATGRALNMGMSIPDAIKYGQDPKNLPWLQTNQPQGVSTPNEEMDFLPFDEVKNNGVLDATHSSLEFESFPQRPFRGERLTISAFSATVADPLSNVIISPALYVGAVQIGATQGGFPATMFAPSAFGVRLSFPRAGQGTRIFVPIQALVALTGANTIVVSVGIIGRAVR